MRRGQPFFRSLLGLLLLCAPAAGQAAPVAPDQNATATANILLPATFRKLNDLNFAMLSVTTAGTATIDPNTDAMTTTGGVLHVGGFPYAALFEAVSPSKNVVIIRIPKNPITVTRVSGTETMTVSDWTLSGQSKRNVVAHEPFTFKVGGTLYVNANQVEGLYVGTFTVDVQYP
jgi:uncharacterized protein DUF4402